MLRVKSSQETSRKRHRDTDRNKNCPQHTASASEQLSITRAKDYQLYQELGICIGEGSSGEVSSPACEPRSGSVESWIKQIGSRIKIIGAQWNQQNVPQILKLRCAYLNHDISLSIYA